MSTKMSIFTGMITIKSLADRTVRMQLEYDAQKPVYAELIGLDRGQEYQCRTVGNEVVLTVPRRGKNGRTQATEFKVDIYQYIASGEKPIQAETSKKSSKFELTGLNPDVVAPPKTKSLLVAVKPKKLSQIAIEKATKRRETLQSKRQEFVNSTALKPVGLDGCNILTCDDVGYAKAAGVIKYLSILENKLNAHTTSESEKKLLNEFYDCFVFSGISCVIALYLALGKKSVGGGNIEYLLNWWTETFRYAFSLTPGQNAKAKAVRIFRGKAAEGLSAKNAEKILSGLFVNPNTGKQFTLADINIEIYQPLIFDDLRSRAYTRGETPGVALVEVALGCGIDPKIFAVTQTEDIGASIGSFRRSLDLPLAQHNSNITITSIGVPLRYQAPKKVKKKSVLQKTMISREASYLTDWLDTEKYMTDNQHRIRYKRIQTAPMDGFSDYSVNRDNLRYAIACGSKAVTAEQKLLI